MYLIDSLVTLFTLKWTQQQPQLRPLPSHIKRTYVKTENGDLEILVCDPRFRAPSSRSSSSKAPIFFAHGGYGSAGVWLEWMTYLHDQGYEGTIYAYSARNHGASYTLPYWRMVFKTPFEHIQADMVACLNYVRQQDSNARPPILVGHSSGGGLSQSLLSGSSPNPKLRAKASGLAVIDAIPSYGSFDIYANWLRKDPWFPLRSMLHLEHPTSPLSTEPLVHGAFFGHRFPENQIGAFKQWMPAFESMGWPSAMVGNSFWAWARGNPNTWLIAKDIYSNLQNAGDGSDKVCVLIGKEDMMYRPWMWERQCEEYRDGLRQLRKEKKVDSTNETNSTRSRVLDDKPIDHVTVTSEEGVRLVLVDDSGHHVQNDVYCNEAAEALLRWARQV